MSNGRRIFQTPEIYIPATLTKEDASTFTKLGVTGIPLVTVVLTLIFSFIALTLSEHSKDFLDLAKLTLVAFIGSFVQRSVELRKQDAGSSTAHADSVKSNLPV